MLLQHLEGGCVGTTSRRCREIESRAGMYDILHESWIADDVEEESAIFAS